MRKLFLYTLLLASLTACSIQDLPEDFSPPSGVRMRVVDLENNTSWDNTEWDQLMCESLTNGCAYSSADVGSDSVQISAIANYTQVSSPLAPISQFQLVFAKVFPKTYPGLIEENNIYRFASPDDWWIHFFLAQDWTKENRSIDALLIPTTAISSVFFSLNSSSNTQLTVIRRDINEEGKEIAILEGTFNLPITNIANNPEPKFLLEDGIFNAVFPLE